MYHIHYFKVIAVWAGGSILLEKWFVVTWVLLINKLDFPVDFDIKNIIPANF